MLDAFQERADANDHFELFTFPYADSALVLERNRTEGPPRPRGRAAAFLNDVVLENWALEAISAAGKALPAGDPVALAPRRPARLGQHARPTAATGSSPTSAASASPRWSTACRASTGPEAARRVIEWVRSNRYPVFFPIEMRVTAADDALLSPSHERDTAYIAVHQYRGMEWRPYFEAVEEIMNDYGGRPHWGKRHFQTAATLAPRYPRWAEFQAARDELDPGRVFTNEYAERVLGALTTPAGEPSLEEGLGPRRGRWGRRRRSRRLRPGGGRRSARRARRPWRGACRRGRRSRGRAAGAPSSGVCTSPAPSSGSSSRPGGSQGEGRRAGVAAAGGEVAAAERGRDARRRACARSAGRSRRPG